MSNKDCDRLRDQLSLLYYDISKYDVKGPKSVALLKQTRKQINLLIFNINALQCQGSEYIWSPKKEYKFIGGKKKKISKKK